MIKFWIFILLLFLWPCPTTGSSQNAVPINQPVYTFLGRMEILGMLDQPLSDTRPLPRGKIAELLLQVAAKPDRLSNIDQSRLQRYLYDYRYELENGNYELRTPEKDWYSPLQNIPTIKKDFLRFFLDPFQVEENHVVLWEDSSNTFYFDYEQGLTHDRESLLNLRRTANWQAFLLRGQINKNFSWQIRVDLQSVTGDRGYRESDPIIKESFSQPNDDDTKIYADRTGAELAWQTTWFDLVFAQQEVVWGPGESGKLTLSNYAEQYPYFLLRKDWNRFRFTSLHGKLQSYPIDDPLTNTINYPEKWLAAHRLEIDLFKNLTIGLNENYIYGQRYVDWAYLLPINFYRGTQHKLRDRDNATISIDWKYRPGFGLSSYGTVFIDEMKKSALGTDWWGNKHALLTGIALIDPFYCENIELVLEYTAVMPWVYTHNYAYNSYTTDYRSLGHWAGPNSQILYAHLKKEWLPRLATGLKFIQYKHGANYPDENIGGDILHGHLDLFPGQTEPRETRKFLEGILTVLDSYQIYAKSEPFNGLHFEALYQFNRQQVADQKSRYNELHLGLVLEY